MATSHQTQHKDYAHAGAFDAGRFEAEYRKRFADVPKFTAVSIPDLLSLLAKIGADTRIQDIRWAAYLLATAFIETSHTIKATRQIKDARGKPRTHVVKLWRNFAPIGEAGHGRGRKYQDAVKVLRVANGAQVTEQDGDQWNVSLNGHPTPFRGTAPKRGIEPGTQTSSTYVAAKGDEQIYYGRGYVQLTWWNAYAAAGAELGCALAFLFNPERTNDPDVAYRILAQGMLTGRIFANDRKLDDYFNQSRTDYVNARNMVNPGAKHAEKEAVAGIAQRFEAVLLGSKGAAQVASR